MVFWVTNPRITVSKEIDVTIIDFLPQNCFIFLFSVYWTQKQTLDSSQNFKTFPLPFYRIVKNIIGHIEFWKWTSVNFLKKKKDEDKISHEKFTISCIFANFATRKKKKCFKILEEYKLICFGSEVMRKIVK